MTVTNKRMLYIIFSLCALFVFTTHSYADDQEEKLLGVKEGWAWPVVIIAPPSGWDERDGESIKLGFRAAERDISTRRDAIRGREATFMFSSVKTPNEIEKRFKLWQEMRVAVIVSFAGGEIDKVLAKMCSVKGPSVIFADGENVVIRDPVTGKPNPYLFALDFSYYARANALAEFAAQQKPLKSTALITDPTSAKLAKGAELNKNFLRTRGVRAQVLTISGYKQDQFVIQVREAESAGVRIIISWLDAMATLSIWRTAILNQNNTTVYFAGNQQKFLSDADGVIIADKDVLLVRNEKGKYDIIVKVRDLFAREVKAPVIASKAYAIGRWIIGGYETSNSSQLAAIASSLANVKNIPLMDEVLSIDPRTNRPKSRKYGVLKVESGKYRSVGSVDVYSIEAGE